jgi:uncharacterized protein (DUF58 family)
MSGRGPTKGAFVIAGIGGALFLAARTTGAGWLLVILCALAGVLLIGLIWPRICLHRVRIAASAPADGTVDEPLPVTLEVERAGLGIRIAPINAAGEPLGDPVGAIGTTRVTVQELQEERGIFRAALLEVSSAAPFGLIWWRRRMAIPLQRAVEVAPRQGSASWSLPPGGALGDTALTHSGLGGDQVRGVRDYTAGDPLRHVHWPATARLGEVMVKEFEQPERPRLELVVDLRGSTPAAERAAEDAMSVLYDALAHGIDVTLITAESGGPRRAIVTNRLDAGRRLARAVAGPLPATPSDGSAMVISADMSRR